MVVEVPLSVIVGSLVALKRFDTSLDVCNPAAGHGRLVESFIRCCVAVVAARPCRQGERLHGQCVAPRSRYGMGRLGASWCVLVAVAAAATATAARTTLQR